MDIAWILQLGETAAEKKKVEGANGYKQKFLHDAIASGVANDATAL